MKEMKKEATELTKLILKALNQEDSPLKDTIELIAYNNLADLYMKGYKEATDRALELIKFKK